MEATSLDVSCPANNRLFGCLLDNSFVTLFWPKKVKASKLEEIHAKMVVKLNSDAPRAASESAAKKPRVSGPKTNGSSIPKTNGKSHR
jgi:chromodomain-helicase-DNA-binding protein 1